MTQKPSSLLNTVHIISDSNSVTIEFKPKLIAFPLMLFGLRLSAVWFILGIALIQTFLGTLILAIILIVASIFVDVNTNLLIKKVIFTKDNIEFKYYGVPLKNEIFRNARELNLTIKQVNEKLKIKILNHTFMLDNAHDLPIITDKISMLLNLEFIETVRLSRGKEVLVYRRK